MRKLICLLFSILLIYGCAVNPVTGEKELSIISESQEISIGEKNYGPSRQMQGGDYVVNTELTAYVNSVGQKLVRVSDRKLPYEFVVLDNYTPNAWALPGGKIAVNVGLLVELNNEAELAAVLGHEIVHAAARHGAKSMQRGMLLQGALVATGIAARNSDYANLVVGGAQVAAGLVHTKYGRDDELEADHYGMLYMSRAGYDPRAAISLQETFVRLSEGGSSNWLAGLFASHPPSEARVEANRATAANLPQGGIFGTESYTNKIASLVKSRKGYESYAKGREALDKGDYGKAHRFADKAIGVEPREGHFYALRGDIYLQEQRYNEALENYDRAIDLNGNYFYYYLQRGLTKKQLNRKQDAYADLQSSTKLLPTAMAYNSLGELELLSGSSQRARQYFSEAASSNSPAGKAAQIALLHMDFPQNAGDYIRIEVGLSRQGYVIARISNNAILAIRDIELQIEYPDAAGRSHQTSRQLSGVIDAGNSSTVNLDLGPYNDAAVLNKLGIRVLGARLSENN
jgi:predicted Zn-dependent protease